jgi:hypothetical protein
MTKFRPRPVQCVNELPQPLETDVALSTLDGAHVGAVNIRLMSERFLR